MFKAVVTSFLILVTTVTWSQDQEAIPGLIPRFYSIEAAVDLSIPGEEAHARALRGEDISLLEPDPTTNIWRPGKKNIPTTNLISPAEKVRFVKELALSRSGQFHFTVETKDKRELIIILSKKAHSFLLRRNILAKLGYETQPMSWVPKLELQFDDSIDRDLFKEEMKDKLFEDPKRWIISEDDLSFTIQDAVVLTPETKIYNLTTGVMGDNIHQGRRLLRAPYVPLALVDTTESANLFSWEAGRLVLNQIKLNHTQDLDNSYETSWEDARWIGRRIGKLSRVEWEEIVKESFFPKAVEALLTEKIVARRNQLIKLLQLEAEFSELPFDPYVQYGDDLVKGEIVTEFFDGYAGRFSYGEPETPMNAAEFGYYTLTWAQAQAINLSIRGLNDLIGTQDQKKYNKVLEGIMKNEGPFFPTQGVVIPTLHGSIVLSREIVTGSYLGTNNRVQLVDSFGFGLDVGLFGGVEGLPIPIGIHAGAGVTFQRVFSHVKPIISLKKSFTEPYKNLIVPFLLKNIAHKIDQLSSIPGEDQAAALNAVVSDLKSSLAVGESFIITDSIVPRFLADVEASITQFFFMDPNLLRAHMKAQMQRLTVTRFHFIRVDENTFHIYQDKGKDLKLLLTVKLKSYVPLITFNIRGDKGTAQTHFYPISLHPRNASVEVLKALRQSLLSLNHSALNDVVNPHRVEHKLGQGGHFLQFLMFKKNRIRSNQNMVLSNAKGGEQKEIYRRYDASTVSYDMNGYLLDSFNNLIGIFLKSDVSLTDVHSLNPGFKLKGSAKNRILTSEYDGKRISTQYQRIINGWEVKNKKMNKLLRGINKEAGRQVFTPMMTVNTDAVRLYQISYTYTLSEEGTHRLLNSSIAQLKHVISKYQRKPIKEDFLEVLPNFFSGKFNHVLSKLNKGEIKKALKAFHSVLLIFQGYVSIRGLEEIVGPENLAYQGKIEGFRRGDEGGDTPIDSDVYGTLPLPLQVLPTRKVMQDWGILEGELLLNWMMERAI